ncbi:hypothetical protein ACTOWJ_13735 [Lysobacter sp. CA199]
MTSLPGFILDALPKPIGDYRDVCDFVARLKQALETEMRVQFRRDADMNYNAGQSLAHELQGTHKPSNRRYRFEPRFYLSAKAPLFAVYCFDRRWGMTDRGGVGHPIAQERLPEAIQAWIEQAKAVLIREGLTEVEHRYFHQPAPGCFTQLDGAPATVFESLFAELV